MKSFSGVIVGLAFITLTMLMSKKPPSFPNNYIGRGSYCQLMCDVYKYHASRSTSRVVQHCCSDMGFALSHNSRDELLTNGPSFQVDMDTQAYIPYTCSMTATKTPEKKSLDQADKL